MYEATARQLKLIMRETVAARPMLLTYPRFKAR